MGTCIYMNCGRHDKSLGVRRRLKGLCENLPFMVEKRRVIGDNGIKRLQGEANA